MNAENVADAGSVGLIDQKRQFLALYRNFLFRVVDLELLSASGDVRNLLGQFAALLAGIQFRSCHLHCFAFCAVDCRALQACRKRLGA